MDGPGPARGAILLPDAQPFPPEGRTRPFLFDAARRARIGAAARRHDPP